MCFSPSHLSISTIVVCRLGSWHASVLGPLPSLSSSGFWPYRLSPGLAISALVFHDSAFRLPSSARSFSRHHLYLAFELVQTISASSIWGIPPSGSMRASFQMSTFLTWSSLVFPLAHHSMRISVVCNFLSPFFLTAQQSAPYTIGFYREIAMQSRTRLATLMGVMCSTSQCELRSTFPNLRVTNVIRTVTFYTLPPLELPTSSWMTRSQRSRRRDKGLWPVL